MSEHAPNEPENRSDLRIARRQFLGDLGRWSGASLAAVIGGAAWLSTSGSARAASWVNRRGGGGWVNGRGGGWVNGRGGGGSWVNRGGGWVNRRGGGGWLNRR